MNQKEEFTVVAVLKACAKNKDLDKGARLHADCLKRGFIRKSPHIASTLIAMYAKCGVLEKAQEVFESHPVQSTVTWNALISGYTQQGQHYQALNSIERMENEGVCLDAITFICALKACCNVRDLGKGKQFHDKIVRRGMLYGNTSVGNALIHMYAKCGAHTIAQEILKDLPMRDAVSWNALIAGYIQNGQGREALKCFDQMQQDDLDPDAVTFVCVLKACGNSGTIDKGTEIHENIVSKGLLEKDVMVGTALVDMYAKMGALTRAQNVFKELPVRNTVSWNALISGYAQHGKYNEAFSCLSRMKIEGLFPDAITFVSTLKACGGAQDIGKGKQTHEEIMSRNLLGKNIVLGNALVDMYAKCKLPAQSQELLEELSVRDVITWSAVIAGYAEQGQGQEALNCFEQMQSEGISPNIITYICILKACGCIGAIEKGEKIYNNLVGKGFFGKDVMLSTAVVDMYVKCGMLGKAQQVLESLSVRNTITWNALIIGHIQQGQCHKALECLGWMEKDHLCLDVVTYVCILKACGGLGALDKGKQIHLEIVSKGLLVKDIVLGNALVDMYAKCGVPVKAQQVLEELPVRDVVTWNALIAGYAQHGRGREALCCLEQMGGEGIAADDITFTCVLIACVRSGLLNEGETLRQNMITQFAIVPNLEHSTSIVASFGRAAGQFNKATAIMKAMPSAVYPVVWMTLLGACRKWGNVELGRLAFDKVIQLDRSYNAAYIHMASVLATAGMNEDAVKIYSERLKYASSSKGVASFLT